MYYKTKDISFLDAISGEIKNLCFYYGYYYFEINGQIQEAEAATEEEFLEAVNSVIEGEPIIEPSQLDRVEEMLNALTAGTISVDDLGEAIAEGVNEV